MENPLFKQLSASIKRAFNHGYIFIVTEDLVQHFPARQWSDQQILDNLFDRYQAKGTFHDFASYRTVELEGRPDILIIAP